jgi:hypothetical protein
MGRQAFPPFMKFLAKVACSGKPFVLRDLLYRIDLPGDVIDYLCKSVWISALTIFTPTIRYHTLRGIPPNQRGNRVLVLLWMAPEVSYLHHLPDLESLGRCHRHDRA